MYKIEGVELNPLEREFLEQCSALGKRVLQIPGLPSNAVRIFSEAKPTLIKDYEGRRKGIYLDVFDPYEQTDRSLSGLAEVSFEVPTIQKILTELKAETLANRRADTDWQRQRLGTSFNLATITTEEVIVALFPDYPRLAMNVVIRPANGIVTWKLNKSFSTVDDILSRKDSMIYSMDIVAHIKKEELFRDELFDAMDELR